MDSKVKKWYCDACGGIVTLENGWLEWLIKETRRMDFRIVHNSENCCRASRKDQLEEGVFIGDHHLEAFIGDVGIQKLLSFLDPGPLHTHFKAPKVDPAEWQHLFRRMYTPYYEETWRQFSEIKRVNENEILSYTPRFLKQPNEDF